MSRFQKENPILVSNLKTVKDLNLEDDFLFAKVMTDEYICKIVLEKILGIDIKEVKMPEEQKVINILAENKGIRLDIYVDDDKGTVYNIEMQKGKDTDLPRRSRYYQGNIDINMITKGTRYSELRKCFVIFICTTFDPFKQGRHLYTFENRCNEDPNLLLGDDTTKVFLTTCGTMNDVDQEMLEFLAYIKNSTEEIVNHSNSKLVQEINKRVKLIKEDKRTEVEYMTLLERDEKNREEGRLEGLEEGIKEGRNEERRRLAYNLIKKGLDDEFIIETTGLTLEEVKGLRADS